VKGAHALGVAKPGKDVRRLLDGNARRVKRPYEAGLSTLIAFQR